MEYGPSLEAVSLNPRFSPESALLKTTLDIRWEEPDPSSSISRLEAELLAFSPSFDHHECRGEQTYHVFLHAARPNLPGPLRPDAGAELPRALEPFDGCLALAHLIEHAIIDFQCTIMELKRCSGVTGAYREPPTRFDVIIECPDCCIGRTCIGLTVSWLSLILEGESLGPAQQEVLAVARLAYQHHEEALTERAVARVLNWSESQAARALSTLQDAGLLAETPYAFNFGGISEYRVLAE